MLLITSKFEPRHLPAVASLSISAVSTDVAQVILSKEDKIVAYISDLEVLNKMKEQFPNVEFVINQFPKKFVRGDRILHVTYYKPKSNAPGNGTSKLDYRLINIES